MRTFRRSCTFLVFGLALVATPVHAQSGSSHTSSSIDWQQRDTATYVVSTLNLLGRSHGGNFQHVLQNLDISHIDVYADADHSNLYYIELKRDSGTLVGSLAYQMGWPKPRRVTWSSGKGVPTVDPAIVQEYKTDTKTLIGSFTSTLPK